MNVNDKVRLLSDIYEGPDEHSPGGYLARKGEILVIRSVHPQAKTYPISISHENITDKSFGVSTEEIELI